MILARFLPSFNRISNDMLSDISFGVVETLLDSVVPKTKLPYVPGWTDVASLQTRVEGNEV